VKQITSVIIDTAASRARLFSSVETMIVAANLPALLAVRPDATCLCGSEEIGDRGGGPGEPGSSDPRRLLRVPFEL
jgi:hypothetical protein